ncbi:LOW QUALITY PROTEIN: queuosine salvage protein-like [Pomacea canaliculata]|uniref:LOW QUALITY PROTEIN: queuosine salvage protein-like n=1 Tax=Pomacea canaliculata TaxID=400727 RepID=UPI000D72C4BB|nr:LOW QUALITY PROTEIN: queuosine salvage protein-like [Pomacea canaliculata]
MSIRSKCIYILGHPDFSYLHRQKHFVISRPVHIERRFHHWDRSSYRGYHSTAAMEGVLPPLDSGKLIANNSKDVSIDNSGVSSVAHLVVDLAKKGEFSVKMWKEHPLNPKTMDEAAVKWVFLADTLNFSFWSASDEEKYMVRYGGSDHTGYWSLCAAINRALDKGIPITDPSFYASISRETFTQLFYSDSPYEMPMIDERVKVLQEAGTVLMQKYGGSFVNCIKECDKSAQSLMRLVLKDFPAYRDIADFNGKKVAFYKRVQILIADIWGACEGKGLGEFHDIDTITMFADYRIPQALVYFGALKYSKELMELLQKDTLLKSGDRVEMEIRGCSIWVTELICQEARKLLDAEKKSSGAEMNAILIDHYLWDYRRDHAAEMADIPFHKVRCIYY